MLITPPLSKALVNVEVLDQGNNAAALENAKRQNANLAVASREVRKSLDETKAMLAQLQQQTNDIKNRLKKKSASTLNQITSYLQNKISESTNC